MIFYEGKICINVLRLFHLQQKKQEKGQKKKKNRERLKKKISTLYAVL